MLWRKKISLLFIVIALFIAGLFLATFLFREAICQGKTLPFMRKLVHLLIPPKDLYEKIDEPVDISSVGSKNLIFSFKYIGPYSIEMYPRNISDDLYGTKYNTPLEATAEFYVDKELILEKEFEYDKAWGIGRGKGIPRCEVNVPLELPIEKEITCVVNVVVPDPYLGQKCDARIIIGKQSEL